MEGTSEAARVYTDTLARSNNEDEAIAGAAKTLAINVPLDVVTNYFGLVADNKLAKSLLKTTFLKATMGKVSRKRLINAAVDILAQAGSGGVGIFPGNTAEPHKQEVFGWARHGDRYCRRQASWKQQ